MAYPGGGGWWNGGGGGYSYSRGGTYPTASPKPAAPPPTTSKTTPANPPAPPPSQLPSTPTPPPNQPAASPTSPNTNPSPNTPGQNNDVGNDGGSPVSRSILSRILSANPSITQSATRTTLTMDSSVVIVMAVYTDNSMSTIYQLGPTQANAAQTGPSETPGTPAGISSERAISRGTIVGALIGGILAALFASWAVWWFWKRNRRTRVSEAFPHRSNNSEFAGHTLRNSPPSEPSFGGRTPRTPPLTDDNLSSPAYTDITNDFLVSQPASPPNEKSRVQDAPIVMEQPQRPALAQLVIPRNDNIAYLRTPSRSSLTTYRTEMTSPPQYATLFNNQPTPNFRLSQLVSPLSPPQDTGPAILSAWTRKPQPYDVERGGPVGPSRL